MIKRSVIKTDFNKKLTIPTASKNNIKLPSLLLCFIAFTILYLFASY